MYSWVGGRGLHSGSRDRRNDGDDERGKINNNTNSNTNSNSNSNSNSSSKKVGRKRKKGRKGMVERVRFVYTSVCVVSGEHNGQK